MMIDPKFPRDCVMTLLGPSFKETTPVLAFFGMSTVPCPEQMYVRARVCVLRITDSIGFQPCSVIYAVANPVRGLLDRKMSVEHLQSSSES